jgi:hypothetical protein
VWAVVCAVAAEIIPRLAHVPATIQPVPFAIMVLGVAAALAGLSNRPGIGQKSSVFKTILYLAVVVGIVTQVAQYSIIVVQRVEQDRQLGYALFAYTRAYRQAYTISFLELEPRALATVLQQLKDEHPGVLKEMARDSKGYIAKRLKLTQKELDDWNKNPLQAQAYVDRLKRLKPEQLAAVRQDLRVNTPPKFLTDMAKHMPYVVGYLYYRLDCADDESNSMCLKAIPLFIQSEEDGRLVAQSYYMLGTIAREQSVKEHNAMELTEAARELADAESDFTKAIESDSRYSAAYYGRAITKVLAGKSLPLDDLSQALQYEGGKEVVCWSLNDPDEIERYWKAFALDTEFKKLKSECPQPQN